MANNITITTATSLVLLLGFCALQARVVVPAKRQNELIQTARLLLSPATSQLPDDLKDPFHSKKVEAPVETEVVEAPEVVRELSDSEVLSLVAQKIKPSGFIDQAGSQYLVLNGKKVQDGVFFNFPHENKRYAIEITEIQTHSFALRLNSESMTISME